MNNDLPCIFTGQYPWDGGGGGVRGAIGNIIKKFNLLFEYFLTKKKAAEKFCKHNVVDNITASENILILMRI